MPRASKPSSPRCVPACRAIAMRCRWSAASPLPGHVRPVRSPIDGATIGVVTEGNEAIVASAMAAAVAGFPAWDATAVETRAAALARAADALEESRGRLIALLQAEGGKTLDDALAEVREAVDYCRYYAQEARRLLAPETMPGPTGETDTLRYRGRGVFICISPWNFPLAIFTGQVMAALAAGNAVVAKPAEQTPLIAAEAVRLFHRAGIPTAALHLVPGDGEVGGPLVAHPDVAGVAFTGSTEVARIINRALAAKEAPIVPLIAETGGINAMIVDATALPEQVTDDVIASAFRSAGQRCSALRLLCLQEDIADGVIAMVAGAAQELEVGDPRDIATHVGPVIDAEAKDKLDDWVAGMQAQGRLVFRSNRSVPASGTFVVPAIIELDRARDLAQEVFGPVLHVVRYRAEEHRSSHRRYRGERLRAHPRGPVAHRCDGPAGRRAAFGRQRLCQPQHDRGGGRHPAVRRLRPVRHRAQGRRPELSAPLRAGAGGEHQHRRGRRQCEPAGGAILSGGIASLIPLPLAGQG